MADIKTRDTSKGTIKTINKAAVATERMKKAYVMTKDMDLCQYFGHKKLKGYADFFNSSSSFCCGVI